jgi:hypothetical protein
VGEHGTGKSSLIQLAVNGLTLLKVVVYLAIRHADDANTSPLKIAETFRNALGWGKDEADSLGATPIELLEIFEIFSTAAIKYRTVFKEIPVLIVVNSNKLSDAILAQFQDFGKEAADKGIAKLVFVSKECRGTCNVLRSCL